MVGDTRVFVVILKPVFIFLLAGSNAVFNSQKHIVLVYSADDTVVSWNPVNNTLDFLVEVNNCTHVDNCNISIWVFFNALELDEWSVPQADNLLGHNSEEAGLLILAEVLLFNEYFLS